MHIVLFDWGPSPFCLKVRAILDYKGVQYERIPVLGTGIFEVRRRGGIGKVPALEIDGRLIVDSTNIAYEIERHIPSPTITPDSPQQNALCHILEDWADEALYFLGLYFQWLDTEGAPMVRKAFGKSPAGRMAHAFYRRRIRAQVIGQGTGRKSASMIEADLEREMAALDGLLEPGPFLLGERPFLCDFAVMAQLVYMSRPPRSARLLAKHPRINAYLQGMRSLRASLQSQYVG